MPTPNDLNPPAAYVPAAATPNPFPDVATSAFPSVPYPTGVITITGMAAATVNAANQTTPGTPGPQGGFQLMAAASTGASRKDGGLPGSSGPPGTPTTLSITPSLLTINDSLNHVLVATMVDNHGTIINAGTLTWSSNNAQVTVVSSGAATANVKGLSGSQGATITVSSSLMPTNGVATALISTGAPVITSVALAPGSVTLTTGTQAETASTVDQFGNAIAAGTGGGSVTFNTGAGVGLSGNNASIASATTLAVELRMRVDEFRALAASSLGLWNIDDGTLASGHTRIACYLQQPSGTIYTATLYIPGIATLATGNIPAASLPANGNDIVVYGSWGPGAGKIAVYTGAGTNTLIDPLATGTSGGGSLATVAGGGHVRINSVYAANQINGSTCRYQGPAVYTAAKAGGTEDTAPTAGDSNIAYLSLNSDATSGTTPSTTTAQVGTGGGLVLTGGDYAWTADSTPGQWNGLTTTYNFVSTNPAIATVNASSGLVTFVSEPGATQINVNVVGQPTVTGSCTITTAVSGGQPDLVNGWNAGIDGLFPHSASTLPTARNPGGCVTWGGPSDPGGSDYPPLFGVVNAAFPGGYCMQFPNGKGMDIQFGSSYGGAIGPLSTIFIEWEHFWDTNVVCSGNFKFIRTRTASLW